MSIRLTKYEKARIIGTRAEQIANGAPIMVNYDGMTDCVEIAKKEFKEGSIPIDIIRTLPNGTKQRLVIMKRK